eukprot:TRINITY_DN7739_c0_g1_i1.p1 TRINITY_DN7739_c0_g1~~TRINITY_DN7739_c0_g1_i1.p1  ORF type:complete len:155 (+),score=25.65 TRINITY_DN7739_c0_g1_i1:1-465(+)
MLAESRPLFWRTCDATLSTAVFGAKDLVFQSGCEAASMYFVKSGMFLYEPRSRRAAKTISDGWISEMPLWTRWIHLGCFSAFDHADLVVVNANRFVQGMCKNWSGCIIGKTYAQTIVKILNAQPRSKLSDITPTHESIREWFDATTSECAAGDK